MFIRYTYPRHPLQQLREEMDRLFTGWVGSSADLGLCGLVRGQPAVNLWEQDNALMAEMELPGVKSDDLEISVVGDELSLKVERRDAAEERATYHRRERPVGSFSRVIRLPVEVDSERVSATLRDGVLTITLPKAESARPRKIQVLSAS